MGLERGVVRLREKKRSRHQPGTHPLRLRQIVCEKLNTRGGGRPSIFAKGGREIRDRRTSGKKITELTRRAGK